MAYDIEDTVRYNNLYDLYFSLLTDKQQLYFSYYFKEDYSLSEIADIMKVSRNAVHLQVKKITSHLEDFEEKLNLLEKNVKRNNLIDGLLNDESIDKDVKDRIKKIEKV